MEVPSPRADAFLERVTGVDVSHFIKKKGRNVVIVFWGAFTEKES